MSDVSEHAVVIDNGSNTIKAGFGGDDTPSVVFQSCVGKTVSGLCTLTENVFGEEALDANEYGSVPVSHPLKGGVIRDFDAMELLWSHTFKELDVSPEEHLVLLSKPPQNPVYAEEKTAEIMFEKLNVPALSMADKTLLSLYTAGRVEGVLVDIGEDVTDLSLSWRDGEVLKTAYSHFDVAGAKLTKYFHEALCRFIPDKSHSMRFSRRGKESVCYVALDYEEQSYSSHTTKLELPDGTTVSLREQPFECPEILFNPQLIGMPNGGIHNAICDAIMKRDAGARGELFENIVLSGGSSMFPGIADRMKKELRAIAPPSQNIKIITPPDRKYSTWVGGSILSCLGSFLGSSSVVTKGEYDEEGLSVVNRFAPNTTIVDTGTSRIYVETPESCKTKCNMIDLYSRDDTVFVSSLAGVPAPNTRKVGYRIVGKPASSASKPSIPSKPDQNNNDDEEDDAFSEVSVKSSSFSHALSSDYDFDDEDNSGSCFFSTEENKEAEMKDDCHVSSQLKTSTVSREDDEDHSSVKTAQESESKHSFDNWKDALLACGINESSVDGIVQLLEENEIEVSQLYDFDHELLKELGIKMGPRMKIMKYIKDHEN